MDKLIGGLLIILFIGIAGSVAQDAVCKGPIEVAIKEAVKADELKHYKELTEEYKAEILHKSNAFIKQEVNVYTDFILGWLGILSQFLSALIVGIVGWFLIQKSYLLLKIKSLTANYQALLSQEKIKKEEINSYFSETKNSLDAREKIIKSGALENKKYSDFNIRDRNNFIQSQLDYASESNSQALSIEAGYSKLAELEKLTEIEIFKCEQCIEHGESVGKFDSKNGEIFIAAVNQLTEALLAPKKDE